MKYIKKLLVLIGILIFLGLVIDTGSVNPPGNALVYVDAESNIYYPPHRTPDDAGWLPTSYEIAKKSGAHPFDKTGFNIDGPCLLFDVLYNIGLWPWNNLKWLESGQAIEYYEN